MSKAALLGPLGLREGDAVVFRRPDDLSRRWHEGVVRGFDAASVNVYDAGVDRTVESLKPPDVARWSGDEQLSHISDLTHLKELNPAATTFTLQQRFYEGYPYTRLGEQIMISINPYRYTPRNRQQPSPHDVGASVLASLKSSEKPAKIAVVVTGTSGAGKTESSKMILSEMIKGSASSFSGKIVEQLEGAHAFLESFGNAVTTNNANSSRFTKLVDLVMKGTDLIGAAVSCYLLETSRICVRSAGESNFHVFYALFDGLSSEDQAEFDLWDMALFKALSPQDGGGGETKSDGLIVCSPPFTLAQITKSLESIGMKPLEIRLVWRVLSAILHLLNVDFTAADDYSAARVSSDPRSVKALQRAAAILAVPQEELQSTLVALTMLVKGESTKQSYNKASAIVCRDALVKTMYAAVFSLIVNRLNSALSVAIEEPNIAASKHEWHHVFMLDIFGFESVTDGANNGLEQLLINTTNEWIQQLFTEQVVQAFDAALVREGIDVKPDDATSTDGDATVGASPALTALTAKQGILAAISDDSLIAGQRPSAAQNLCDKILEMLATHPNALRKPKLQKDAKNPVFVVRHYADDIAYSTAEMAARNRLLPSVGPKLSQSCFDNYMADLLKAKVSPVGFVAAAPGRPAVTSVQGPTSLAAAFKEQLESLLVLLKGTETFWVRCIKPNLYKAPDTFTTSLVEAQLRYGGVYHCLQQLGRGLAVRLSHREFATMGIGLLPHYPADDMAQCRFKSIAAAVVQHLARVADEMLLDATAASKTAADDPSALKTSRVGLTKVCMTRAAASVFRELCRQQQGVLAKIFSRVGRGYVARRALGPAYLVAMKEQLAAARVARLAAERPVRMQLEVARLQHEHDRIGFVRDRRLGSNAAALKRSCEVLATVPAIVSRIETEFKRATAEIAFVDEKRLQVEKLYEERELFAHQLQAAAADKAAQEAERRAKAEWDHHQSEERRRTERLARDTHAAAQQEREKHLRRIFAAARQEQARSEALADAAEIEHRKALHAASQRRWTHSHLEKAQQRIAREVEIKRTSAHRSSVVDELFASSMQKATQRSRQDPSRAKLTDLLGLDANALHASVSRSSSVQAIPHRERSAGGTRVGDSPAPRLGHDKGHALHFSAQRAHPASHAPSSSVDERPRQPSVRSAYGDDGEEGALPVADPSSAAFWDKRQKDWDDFVQRASR